MRVVEEDDVGLDPLGAVVQHEREEDVVRLDLDRPGPAGLDEPAEQRERPAAMSGQDVELRDRLPRLVPDAADEPVADDPAVEPEQVGVGPAAPVPGVEDDLAVHLLPVELAQGQRLLPRYERDVDRHRDLPHARE